MRKDSGFTLIEVVVVASIIMLMSGFLIANLSKTRVNLDQTLNLMIADIRDAQSRAVSSDKSSGKFRCGYGIRYVSGSEYRLYAGPDASLVTCSTQNRNYALADGDVDIRTIPLRDKGSVQITVSFPDIFFEPPDPKTYVNNSAVLSAAPGQIKLSIQGANCAVNPDQCRIICVYTSGRIDSGTGATCP